MPAVAIAKSHRGLVPIAVFAVCVPAPGAAQGWHGSVALTSDYVFRGVSQTQGDGAAQGDLHYEGSTGGFVGLWVSSIAPAYDSYGEAELNFYAGWNLSLAPDWAARVAYVRYVYPGAARGVDYDYDDGSVRLAWRDRIVGTVAWSPNLVRYSTHGYAERGDGYTYELALRQPLGTSFAANVGAGYYDQPSGIRYGSWNVGLAWQVASFELALSRFASDGGADGVLGKAAAGERWALSALWQF